MTAVDRTRLPLPGADRAFTLPAFERADLGGGTAVWAAEHRRAPLVALHLLLPAGSAADPPEAHGLAALTAELFTEGTAELSAVELESALKRIGGVLTTAVRSDATVIALTVLSQHMAAGLRLLFEVAMRPRLDAGGRRPRARAAHQPHPAAAPVAGPAGRPRVPGRVVPEPSLRASGARHGAGFAVGRARRRGGLSPACLRCGAVDAGGGRRRRPGCADRRGAAGMGGRGHLGRPPPRTGRAAGSAVRPGADGLRRAGRRGAVGDSPGPCRPAPELARLPRAAGTEHGAGRAVRQPRQPESARGERLHVRRIDVVRLAPGTRAIPAADQRADGVHGGCPRGGGARGGRHPGGAPPVRAGAGGGARGADARLPAHRGDRLTARAYRGAESRCTGCRRTTM